jgi:signal transduction histidine kinase
MSEPAVAASSAVLAPWPWAASLLIVGAAGWAAWATWRWWRERDAAYLARTDHAQWLALSPDWLWQTDDRHTLRALRPPAQADATSGAGAPDGWQGRLLWDLWPQDQAPAGLRERLEAGGAIEDLPCSWPGSAGPPGWRLSAAPQFDRSGRFRGHLGRLSQAPGARLTVPTDTTLAPVPPSAPTSTAMAASEASSFMYTVSHDLRAPIRVVEGFTRIVKEDYGHLLDRVGVDHLDRVLSAAARMNSMIDALLALSRLSQQPLSCQPVDLSQLARYVLEDLQRAQPERRVQVEVQPDLAAHGDPTLLRMALENLLGNAWKYTSRTTDAQIRFEGGLHQGMPMYRVIDNGAGFDMRFADRLFGVFQRLHGASEFPGTGVGLASVRRIVQRHGGQIWAESVLGQGSTFSFTLSPTVDRHEAR